MGGSGALGGCGEAIRRLWGPWEHLGRYVSVGRVWGLWAYRKGGVGRLEGGCGALESCVALRKGSKLAVGGCLGSAVESCPEALIAHLRPALSEPWEPR